MQVNLKGVFLLGLAFSLAAPFSQATEKLPSLGKFFDQQMSFFGPKYETNENEIFVIMPLSNQNLTEVYTNIIKPTAEENDMFCYRASDFKDGRMIMHDIWQAISSARIVVVDVTGYNPNVMYELGIAHALGKDTIMVFQQPDDLKYFPIDVSHLRRIQYKNTAVGGKQLEKELRQTIYSLLTS